MGDPITALAAAVGVSWFQGEEAKKEARRAEERQKIADRKIELTAEAQRQADLMEKRKQEDLLPPIIGSQTPSSETGLAALESDADTTLPKTLGVQIGTTKEQGAN